MADPTRDPERDRPVTHLHRAPTAVITDARGAASAEQASRVRRYTITMAFRMACFVSMIFVHGSFRWALLAFAVFLPYIAVVLANQSDQRSSKNKVEQGAPVDAPQLTTGEQVDLLDGEIVEGSVVEDDAADDRRTGEPEGRVA